MKKMVFLGCLVLLFPTIVYGQEKIEVPVWNVGDKWALHREGSMEVVGIDKNGYVVKFSGGIFQESQTGTAIFSTSNLNILYLVKATKLREYIETRRRLFDFPLTVGKQWKDCFYRRVAQHTEAFSVVGWEEIEVRAGKFRALKLEYKLDVEVVGNIRYGAMPLGPRGTVCYWYSPEVKNFVKCQPPEGFMEGPHDLQVREGWELASFQLKK
jgi:hypothetical protein